MGIRKPYIKYIAGNNDFKELMDICSWGSPGAVVTPNCVFPVVRDQNYEQTSHEVQLISDFWWTIKLYIRSFLY